jgi:methyltransferase (TIGR00027 family)
MADSNRASKTALMAAIHRFLAHKENDFQGPDDMARIFLPRKVRFFLSFKFIRESIKKKMRKFVPGTYEYVTGRTNFCDEQFKLSVEEDWPQIVLLGAGYDTRFLRFQSRIKNTKVFELDEATIQSEKKRLLEKAGIKVPANHVFVAVNFNTDKLEEVLNESGYESLKRTLFLWEGVSMYLEQSSVEQMLTFISGKSAKGSRIVFDYFDKEILEGNSQLYGAKEIAAEVKKSNEPFQFGIDPNEIDPFLEKHNLKLVTQYAPEKLEAEYLTNDKNVLFGHVYGFGYQVVAEVPNI